MDVYNYNNIDTFLNILKNIIYNYNNDSYL